MRPDCCWVAPSRQFDSVFAAVRWFLSLSRLRTQDTALGTEQAHFNMGQGFAPAKKCPCLGSGETGSPLSRTTVYNPGRGFTITT